MIRQIRESINWKVVGGVVSGVVATATVLLGAAWQAGDWHINMGRDVQNNTIHIGELTQDVKSQDERIDTLEETIPEMATNIEWLVEEQKSE